MISLPKPRPRILDKRDRQREADAETRDVYEAVKVRDGSRCRCCGRTGQYGATQADRCLHRHHLIFRSQRGADTTTNLASLCAYCHALIHARQLWIVGTDANHLLKFEIHEAAVIDLFATKALPSHVHIITARRKP